MLAASLFMTASLTGPWGSGVIKGGSFFCTGSRGGLGVSAILGFSGGIITSCKGASFFSSTGTGIGFSACVSVISL